METKSRRLLLQTPLKVSSQCLRPWNRPSTVLTWSPPLAYSPRLWLTTRWSQPSSPRWMYAGKSSVLTTEPAPTRSISSSTALFVMFFATVRMALPPRSRRPTTGAYPSSRYLSPSASILASSATLRRIWYPSGPPVCTSRPSPPLRTDALGASWSRRAPSPCGPPS